MSNSISPLLVVAGPTASGKSALALHLARRFSGEIVNCDSLQIYRGMDIGTAKPSIAERESLPHYLFDARNPDQVFTAGEYSRLGRPILREIASRHQLPIVTGGAGFYLKALLEGLFPGPLRSDALRQRLEGLESRRSGSLHRVLNGWDATAALRIHSNDTNKLIRALEVILTDRQTLTAAHQQQRAKLDGFRILKFGLRPPRSALRERIELRSRHMFEVGLLQEVEALRMVGFGVGAKAMESVGYRQAHAVLDHKMSLEQAILDTSIRTAQYSKRQMTWFKRDSEIIWLEGFGDEPSVQAQAESHLKQFLLAPSTFLRTDGTISVELRNNK